MGFLGIVMAMTVTVPTFAARAPRAKAPQVQAPLTGTLEQMIATLNRVGLRATDTWIEQQLPTLAQKIRSEAIAKKLKRDAVETLIIRVTSTPPVGPFAAQLRALVFAPVRAGAAPARVVVKPAARMPVVAPKATPVAKAAPIMPARGPAASARFVPRPSARPVVAPVAAPAPVRRPAPAMRPAAPARVVAKPAARIPVVVPKAAPAPVRVVARPALKTPAPQVKVASPRRSTAQEKVAEQQRMQAAQSQVRRQEAERVEERRQEQIRLEAEQKKEKERKQTVELKKTQQEKLAEKARQEAERKKEEDKAKQAALEAGRIGKEKRQKTVKSALAPRKNAADLQQAMKESGLTFEDLVERSNNFYRRFAAAPNLANRIATIAGDDDNKKEHILEQAHDVRLLVHDRVMKLISDFLVYSLKYGTSVEKAVYAGIDLPKFINRLISNRPVVFFDPLDTYLLRDGKTHGAGRGNFERIGGFNEASPLLLKDYLSYDELQIAALLGMSAPTYFINNGTRENQGIKGASNSYVPEGVYTGLVGTQFEKQGLMEWKHMIVTEEQNTPDHGYGSPVDSQFIRDPKLDIWAKFYNIPYFYTFKQAEADTTGRFLSVEVRSVDEEDTQVWVKGYLDKEVYKERIKMVVLPFLDDADGRGEELGKKVYAQVIGLGTGTWAVDRVEQEKMILEVYAELLGQYRFPWIDTINFSWFEESVGKFAIDSKLFKKGSNAIGSNTINIVFSERNPADALVGADATKLLVAMYARNGGGAYPGNEYWQGVKNYSSDSAAICSSTLSEVLNPEINKENLNFKNVQSTSEKKPLAQQQAQRRAAEAKKLQKQLEKKQQAKQASQAATTPAKQVEQEEEKEQAAAAQEKPQESVKIQPKPEIKSAAKSGVTFETLVERSAKFGIRGNVRLFKTEDNRIVVIAGQDKAKQERIAEHANTVRLVMHKKILALIDAFLTFKRGPKGSKKEHAVYAGMTTNQFIDRLITNRPLAFLTENDTYLLRDGVTKGQGGEINGEFEQIGTENEKAPLVLKEYLSYDEMQIAALLGVSVPTYFINDGGRYNRGIKEKNEDRYEQEGIYTGLVGARFEKPGLMEWRHMMITADQNTAENGYGAPKVRKKEDPQLTMWAQFYEVDYFYTHDEAKVDTTGRFVLIEKVDIFGGLHAQATVIGYLDTYVYKKRMQAVLLPFLIDANERGKKEGKLVQAEVVGLGLGVWAASKNDKTEQTYAMLRAYAEILQKYDLPNIDGINFDHFVPQALWYANKQNLFTNQRITVTFENRNPAGKLDGKKLLVAMYAWDGGSYPGNEYWLGQLAASGDPAAICCSTLGELQNPEINTENVSSKNMLIAE